MDIVDRERFRAAVLRYIELPGARFLHALKLTPNAITLLGFAVCVAASILAGGGWLLAGGILFLAGSALDLMDGALARLTNTVRPFGALLDSVFDRLGEAALFLGLVIYGIRADFSDGYRLFFVTVMVLALIFSQGVSYLRARGEGLGVFTRAGIMTRPERVVLLGIGLISQQIVWFVLAIAVVSCFTLFQRMFTIRGELDKGG
jgi:CDP-diacylglycerol--glycerol-3-phosphate 3-phosphatidyltransferase